MTANIFDLPDVLVAHTIQSTAYGQNTQTANQLLAMARLSVPAANATLSHEQIDLIMVAVDKHFDTATQIATQWEAGDPLLESKPVKDEVANVFYGFERFARHMDAEYKTLIEAAYAKDEDLVTDKLKRLKSILEILLADNKGASTSVSDYQSSLASALSDFNADYKNVLAEVGNVSAAISGLKSKISSLQDNIAENNAAVLDAFLDTAGTEIEQGVAMAGSAAEENVAGVASAGVQMGVAYVKGLVKVIELNEKTLEDLLEIRKLGKQVGQDEVILLALMNIGTMLASLGATRGLQLDIVDNIMSYWAQLDDNIASILQNHEDDPASQIDVTNFSPETESQQNPAFPPWNVLAPTDRAARVFNKVMSLKPNVFDDKTKFEKLS